MLWLSFGKNDDKYLKHQKIVTNIKNELNLVFILAVETSEMSADITYKLDLPQNLLKLEELDEEMP